MEMHPLASAPHSLKDLLIHIGIVTVGILIALSLEGIRESIHDHHLVRDARETFRIEIQGDLDNMNPEIAAVDKAYRATQAVIADLPNLQRDPAQLKQRVAALHFTGYSLDSSSWEGALSSGALSHMGADEVRRYADFNVGVRWYSSFEDRSITQVVDLQSYVESRHAFGPNEMEEVEDKLRSVEALTQMMSHVGREARDSMQQALPK